MILDGHIHIEGDVIDGDSFLRSAEQVGIDGGIVISQAPDSYYNSGRTGDIARAAERLEGLFARTSKCDNLYPFFWIDPLEPDACEQVSLAYRMGVCGFKVICDRYYPYDNRPMEIFSAIANFGKPVLFHSGILWDGKFSSIFNRPVGFEALLKLDGLRFALAHASWPWIDECIALYGKVCHARENGCSTAEMFIDITPGTPEIYREELLTKLFTVGYNIENNIFFGVDGSFDNYSSDYAKKWIDIDSKIFSRLQLSKEVVSKVFSGNARRFLGFENVAEYSCC
jgi:predicted TIM-barrel fold metal-dependent hydrolase